MLELGDDEETLARAVEPLLGDILGHPSRVIGLDRFHGGAARETYRLNVETGGRFHGIVLRRDPPSSLIDTDRRVEHHALARAFAAGLPVPEPLHLDADGAQFGSPGFLMREVAGGRAPGLFEPDPYGASRASTGHAVFTALGRLHALVPDPVDRAILPMMDAPGRLHHWALEIDRNRLAPEPVADAARRWLAANLPLPSGPPAIVHGDFRSGNFLVGADGALLAILDWEMVHIGDPMEDLAWAMDPLWAHGDPARAGAMLPPDAAIAAWEAASGRQFIAAHWPWWRLFAGFAGLAIWITSAAEVARHRTVDPVMTFAGLYPYRFHNAQVAALLEALA